MPSKSGRIAAVVQYSDKYGDDPAQIVADRKKMSSKDKAFPRQEQTAGKALKISEINYIIFLQRWLSSLQES